ncbi:MAG: cysteine--tRNA ligase [Nitrosopumilales archaeon]|nr:cysteine--tRNA ligase [Nitrosopumilales archaeon]
MEIFDTLSESEKELDTSKKIRIYLCGVTVYDEAHIGHARTIIVFDVLRKFLESKENMVEFIQNFTDVDDKIIDRAQKEGATAYDISVRYIEEYFRDFDALNVKRATRYPKATEHIKDMIALIDSLVQKKIAYVSKNGVYFAVSRFSDYGKLSKKKIDDLISGSRVDVDETKNDPLDFALWKFSEESPLWDSPWGKGRPGWHIECSAMSIKYLGENFEIHGGGRDLIFPHHENEIAQSESFTSKPFAKIWMHVGMVTINGEKMSKSLGNIRTVKYVLQKYGPNIIRLFCLSGHYSKPIDYSEDLLKENIVKWRQVETCYYELLLAEGKNQSNPIGETVLQCSTEFDSALSNDFNTSLALTAFFKLVKEINRLAADELLSKSIAEKAFPELERMISVLGLAIPKITSDEINSINQLIKKRESLRQQKKYQEADNIREQISKMGIELIDHKNRTAWMKKEKIQSDIS